MHQVYLIKNRLCFPLHTNTRADEKKVRKPNHLLVKHKISTRNIGLYPSTGRGTHGQGRPPRVGIPSTGVRVVQAVVRDHVPVREHQQEGAFLGSTSDAI